MKSFRNPSIQCSGFTLVEALVAMLLFSVIAAICLGSYVTLRRGFTFITTWSDLNNSIVRVVDSVETDLRNASCTSGSDVVITNSTDAPSVQTLTLQIPKRYSNYIKGDSRLNPDNPVARAGDPAPSPSPVLISGTYNTSTGKIVSSGTITVIYSGTTAPSTGKTLIYRTAIWSGSTAELSGTGTRTVATFPNGVSLSYYVGRSNSSGGLVFAPATSGTILRSSDCAVRLVISGTVRTSGTALKSSGTLQDTVYLRAHNMQ